MLAKVIRFDRDRRCPGGRRTRPPRQTEETLQVVDVHPAVEESQEPRGLLSLVSVRILRDDDDSEL